MNIPLSDWRLAADNQPVEAAEQAWRPLGELLLAKGLISQEELDKGLAAQEETGRLLGAILVERGYVSGPALAIALAEQYGVELEQQQGFGTGLWAEIERRHRSERGVDEPEPSATLLRLEPAIPSLEAVPDPEPDPRLEQLEAENRVLQDEIERLRAELTMLGIMEERDLEPDPKLEQLEAENRKLQDEIDRLSAEFTMLRIVEEREPDLEPEPELPSSHLLFVPTPERYLLVERQGPPPLSGDEVALSQGSFVVGKLGPAPVPGDSRACAFLLASA